MKISFLLILLSSAQLINSQTVFTDVFAPDFPTDIQIIDDDLYVGCYVGGYIAKMPLSDPGNVAIVSDNFLTGGGPWKMDHDPINNIFYTGVFPGIPGCYEINLNNPLPVDSEFYTDFNFFDGLDVNDTMLYFSGTDENGNQGVLYAIDLNSGPSSSELFYSDPDESLRNPVVLNNYIYYGTPDVNNNDFTTIYRLDLNSPNPIREYIATVGEGYLQASIVQESYLYLGLEYGFDMSKIVRINLDNQNIPIPQEIIITGINAGILGMAISGENLYYTEGGTGKIMVYNDPVLNTSEALGEGFKLSKNPVADYVDLIGVKSQEILYHVYTIEGKLLLTGRYQQVGINVESLKSGIYVLALTDNTGTQNLKFIKN